MKDVLSYKNIYIYIICVTKKNVLNTWKRMEKAQVKIKTALLLVVVCILLLLLLLFIKN